ncbi:YceI family protein [Pontibacter qinzhouensis]|uniref:YceI family protein n=1 Tax=Pontibacter qinzhouensis TaxID=2603253 RepID=A0A5C8IYY6_9BACT|nr:YceI family protein [Pontibacter qinzhouensis]TXK26316.1 YceI family protein [Pontibacter qinzhouensis]
MKKTAILASVVAAFMFSAFTNTTTPSATIPATEVAAPAKAVAYKVEAAKSEVKWHAKKVTGEHMGNIKLKEGQILVDGNKPTGGTFVIDMNSITCTDIADKEYNGKLIGHLKNDDFFSVDKFPTSTFKITSLAPVKNAAAGKPNYTVKGDLTIKGITNPVEFPAVITVKNGAAAAKADVVVNRAKYDIRYGSTSFFDSLGDKAIDDNFTLSLNIAAKQ